MTDGVLSWANFVGILVIFFIGVMIFITGYNEANFEKMLGGIVTFNFVFGLFGFWMWA